MSGKRKEIVRVCGRVKKAGRGQGGAISGQRVPRRQVCGGYDSVIV